MIHLVEIETKLRKDGVIQIPDKELEATGLHEGDIYLSERADKEGQCWPAVPTIDREIKLSEATVRRAIRDLRKAGLVETEQWYRTKGGKSSLLFQLKDR